MNNIKTSPRGFPFDELTLQELQDQTVPILNALAKLIPDNSIIFGCAIDDLLAREDGFIIWNGELLPFKGGVNNAEFSIVQETENRTFNIGTEIDPQLEDHPAYERRWAEIGNILDAESVHQFSELGAAPKFLSFLVKGTIFCGNLVPVFGVGIQGTVIEINFTTVGSVNYMVFSSFNRAGQSTQGEFDFEIFDRTAIGFKLLIKNISEPISNLFYQYLVVPSSDGAYIDPNP
jgi:hypothetical protein